MLGGYGIFGSGAYVQKTFGLSGAPAYSEVRVQLNFVKIDTWDGESAYLRLNGELVWSQSFVGSGGGSEQCGGTGMKEQLVPVDAVLHGISASSVTVRVDTDLDSAATGEAWGIQDVRVSVSLAPSPSPPPLLPPFVPGFTLVEHDVFPGATGWGSNRPLNVTSCGELGSTLM